MPNEQQRFTEWNLRVAELLTSIDDLDRLPELLVHALRTLAPASVGFAAMHLSNGSHVELWSDLEGVIAPEYAEGLYVLDPLFTAYKEGRFGCLTLHREMPARFEETPYFRWFYSRRSFADELVHLTPLPGSRAVAVGLIRSHDEGIFTESEIARHESAHPLVSACSLRLAMHVPEAEGPAERSLSQGVEGAMDRFGAHLLTPREHEVVDLVLRGHNTESAAERLGIARDTVKLHKKRAYAKLGVSSQGELFFKFLESFRLPPSA